MFERGNIFERTGDRLREGNKKTLVIAAAIIVVLAIIAGFFIWRTMTLSANPNAANEEKSTRIVGKVSKIFALPDEKPTVAEISDKDAIKDQTFFDKAQNGDFLLVYSEAKFALIYREKDNKIINAGPVTGATQK